MAWLRHGGRWPRRGGSRCRRSERVGRAAGHGEHDPSEGDADPGQTPVRSSHDTFSACQAGQSPSAWESVPSGPVTWPDLRGRVSASDRERPLVTGLMARQWPGDPDRAS